MEYCLECNNEIPKERQRRHAKTCSRECAVERQYTTGKELCRPYNLSTGKIGAVQELSVAADLLLRGYDVFRAVSPSSSCDIVILHKKKLYRVEVKTGHYGRSGELYYPKGDSSKYDFLAVVITNDNKKIKYFPQLPELKVKRSER